MVTWQIVTGLGQAHSFRGGSSYPAPFSYFVNMIEVFMLDLFVVFHTECVAHTSYADKLMVALLTVAALGVVAVVIGAILVYMEGEGTVLRSSSVKTYIVLIYMVLPTMSSMAFSTFNCDHVSKGVPRQPATTIHQPPIRTN